MTPELITQWAREAGAYVNEASLTIDFHTPGKLQAFADKVAAHEREMCALVCDNYQDTSYRAVDKIAAAIRGRKG